MSDIRAIRGMVDVLPNATARWQQMERVAATVLAEYGYSEIRLPIVESTQLFARSIGEVTDIVEKEMYSFPDRNGDSLSLRPEGTAGCVRAMVQHNLLTTAQRVWYLGPMFRYERPQKGRQRQFHQLGVEAFGISTPDLDAELILIARRLWESLGISSALTLEINTIGSSTSRRAYRDALVAYLAQHKDALDEDSQRRLETNPLRILDSKSSTTQELLNGAPLLDDFLDQESLDDFAQLLHLLDVAGVKYRRNARLVRGLDYYNKTVFEWTTEALGAQGTVCGGGRYDGLVTQFGGKHTPAAGFAIGLERLQLLLESLCPVDDRALDFYVVLASDDALAYALPRIEALRTAVTDVAIEMNLGGGSFKSQFKRADKSGARWALVFGADEVANGSVTVKPLRGAGEQQTLTIDALEAWVTALLAAKQESGRG